MAAVNGSNTYCHRVTVVGLWCTRVSRTHPGRLMSFDAKSIFTPSLTSVRRSRFNSKSANPETDGSRVRNTRVTGVRYNRCPRA